MNASKLGIAPIGTCRIHTPLRRGAMHYPIKSLVDRNYGFVHTSTEALQQIRFILGLGDVPADIQPLTFRPSMAEQVQPQSCPLADVYLVELSSRKLLTVDDRPIQINYTARHFADFFADRKRSSQFWSMGTASKLAERRRWLDSEPTFGRMTAADRDLLARVMRRTQSDADIEREMQEIADLVGKDRLIFVTHVDATTPDDMVIEQRHRLIELVRAVAGRMGIDCYDPTPAMNALGQANALEDGGLDLTHYTEAFAERLCSQWYERYFAPRTGLPAQAGVALADGAETADIEAAWNTGRLCEASRRLRALLRVDPTQSDRLLLLARMQHEMGDYEGCIALLEARPSKDEPHEKADLLLMRSYFEMGRYREAQRLAAAMEGDEIETPELLRLSALIATHLGDTATALTHWKRLFRSSDSEQEAATKVLELLADADSQDEAALWADEVRTKLPAHGPSFAAQWRRLVSASDRQGLLALAGDAIRLEPDLAMALLQHASERGFAAAGAALVVAQDIAGRGTAVMVEDVARRAKEWLSNGNSALERGELLIAADLIQAASSITASGQQAIKARRALERRLRQEARAAFVAKDHAAVIALVDIALSTNTTFTDLNSIRGRTADALGDSDTAVRFMRLAADEPGAPLATRQALARVALRGQHYLEALDAYARIAATATADEVLREEAQRQIRAIKSRSIRTAREFIVSDRHEEAWALLDAIDRSLPHSADVAQEKKRVVAALHVKLRALDTTSVTERMQIAEAILRLQPQDPVGLKAAAMGAMRLHRFGQAMQYWQGLREQSEVVDQIDKNIRKCALWIERKTQRTKVAPAALSMAS